jgi:hypothetical protein
MFPDLNPGSLGEKSGIQTTGRLALNSVHVAVSSKTKELQISSQIQRILNNIEGKASSFHPQKAPHLPFSSGISAIYCP